MNWYLIIILGVLAIILIIFLEKENQKDEIELEDKLKDNYTKPNHKHVDTEMDRKT
jgi:hypothetical protein